MNRFMEEVKMVTVPWRGARRDGYGVGERKLAGGSGPGGPEPRATCGV